jgi:hypothetical protein
VVFISIHISKFWGRKKFFGNWKKYQTFTVNYKKLKNMSLEIPGLIANSKENSKLTSAELQAKRDSFEAYMKSWKADDFGPQVKALNQSANSNVYHTGVDPYHGLDLGQYQQPFVDLNQWKYVPYDQGLKKTSDRSLQTQDMVKYLQEYLQPKKSEFEILLDAMFDTSEKEQFLITLGFEFKHENGEDYMERTVAGLLEKGKKAEIFDKIFLREMTIKFKNLLISKNSLKMKL